MTTIQEARERTKRQVQAETTIEIKYPNTRLMGLPGGQAWTSTEMLDDATHITLLGRPHVHVSLTVHVEGIAVHHPTYLELSEAMEGIQAKDPETYQRLVHALAETIRTRTGCTG